jgi:hypothetical protein
MLKKLVLVLVTVSLAAPVFADAPVSGGQVPQPPKSGKGCPKGEVRDYSCKPGTGPGSKDDKPCEKVWGKCVVPPPQPK